MSRSATGRSGSIAPPVTPLDHRIPTLETACSPGEMAPLLEQALQARGEAGIDQLVGCELLRVRAGRRCVLRYTMASTESTQRLVLAAKIRVKGVNRRVESACEKLRSRGFREAGNRRFVVAEPMGSIAALNMNLVRWYGGETLQEQLSRGAARRATFEETGAALAEFHAAPLEAKRTHRLDDEMSILHRDLNRAATERPEDATRIWKLLEQADLAASRIRPIGECLVHRDFHPEQILDGEHGLVLLDLDLHARSDPRVDVGNFVAHLREQALRDRGTIDGYAEFERAFLDGYRSIPREAGFEVDIDAWTFLSLLRHLYIAWRIPARRKALSALLDACEALALQHG